MLSPPLGPEKYAEPIGEIRFQIRSQSREIFAILWPSCLLFPIRRNAASTTTRVADTSHWATPCAAISSFTPFSPFWFANVGWICSLSVDLLLTVQYYFHTSCQSAYERGLMAWPSNPVPTRQTGQKRASIITPSHRIVTELIELISGVKGHARRHSADYGSTVFGLLVIGHTL